VALRGLEAQYAATVGRLELRIAQAEAQSRLEARAALPLNLPACLLMAA
jgi:hypothetical protein